MKITLPLLIKHKPQLIIALMGILSLLLSPICYSKLKISSEVWGEDNNRDIYLYTLSNDNGMQVQVTNWGAYVTSIKVADKQGNIKEVTLGYNSAEKYVNDCCYSGATVGRYANRIHAGTFSIDGASYQLTTNNGKGSIKNHLHGGNKGLNKYLWAAKIHKNRVEMTLQSPDGDQGYPGELSVSAIFSLTPNNELSITYKATTNKPTPVNLVSHIYFNLSGDFSKNIESHMLQINASKTVAVTDELIPTGRLNKVKETIFDFNSPAVLSSRLHQHNEQMILAGGVDQRFGGFDHTWVLANQEKEKPVKPDALLYSPASGITLEVFTTQPGLHVYTGNFMNSSNVGRNGLPYIFRNGLALEAQNFADAPNQSAFPNSILDPSDTYQHTTTYKLSTNE